MKTISAIKKDEGIKIIQTMKMGIYTLVQVEDEKGNRCVGISRRGENDKYKEEIGFTIAKGRAEKGLKMKNQDKKINHPLMG